MPKDIAGWIVYPESEGLQRMDNSLGAIAKFLCVKHNTIAGFAFAVSLFERAVNPRLTDKELLKLAEEKINEYLSKDLVSNCAELTFVYQNGEFREDPNASWWKKTL